MLSQEPFLDPGPALNIHLNLFLGTALEAFSMGIEYFVPEFKEVGYFKAGDKSNFC